MHFFERRNVVMAAGRNLYEPNHDENKILGNENIRNDIQRHQKEGGSFSFFCPDEKGTIEAARKIKADFLKAIVERERPATFIFDGHGTEEALVLAEALLDDILQAFVFQAAVLEKVVAVGDVGLVVLAVMKR